MKLVTLLFVAAISPLYSQSVIVSAIDGFTGRFLNSAGGALPLGSLIRVGTFDLTGGNLAIIQNSSDFQTIDALFTPLAESQNGSGTVSQSGNSGDTLVVNDASGSSGSALGQINGVSPVFLPAGTDLFFWVLNAANSQSATEFAIAGSSLPSFELPQAPGTTTITPENADNILIGTRDGIDILLVPITAVPEPSVAWLISISFGLLLGRRSRA